ncbi:hypothetical protein BDR06DRAFT_956261 [Suillus hirtellus]|nr:hypothetical protein BDR06DRAFT_956261 [Suillus hirtellus]
MDTSRLLYVHGTGICTPPPPTCAHPTIMFEIATFSSHLESLAVSHQTGAFFSWLLLVLHRGLLLTCFNFQTVIVRRPDY